jgi:hypothetical protein
MEKATMEELEVTRLWMAGVVGMMLVFATIALAGYVLHRRRDKTQ